MPTTPDELLVRPMSRDDNDALRELYRRTFDRFGPPFWSSRHIAHVVVAMLEDRLVGFGFSERVGPHPRAGLAPLLDRSVTEDQTRWHMPEASAPSVLPGDTVFTALAVEPDCRRLGIGIALSRARIEEAGSSGSEHLFVHCVQGTGSQDLYASLGFRPILSVNPFYRNGAGMTLMSRDAKTSPVFKILTRAQWEGRGETVPWAPIDVTDGFLHLSAAHQLEQTLALHFAGQTDLVILELDPTRIPRLVWEQSRGGALFPHAYDDTPLDAVVAVEERTRV